MELLAADKRCISGTAHSLIIDHNNPTYVFKDIKTLTKRKEEKTTQNWTRPNTCALKIY